ncbi:MAG: TolC family protein [Deltaproteobacteria bacterium]
MKPLPWKLLTGVVLVLMLNGCAVNQQRDQQIYRRVLDAGSSGAVAPFQPESPLSLQAALELANAHNEQLAIAGEDYLQSLLDEDRAFAAFLPTISFVPEFMRQEPTSLAAGNPLIAQFVPDRTTDLPLKAKLDLHPFYAVPALQGAGSATRMQRALLRDRQAILMLDVARTYFQVLHAEEQTRVLRHSIEVDRQRLADMRVKEKAGVSRPVDVALTETELAKSRNSLILAKNDVKNSRAMLALLTGTPEVTGPLTGGLAVPSAEWRLAPLLPRAEKQRQDLVAAHEQVAVAAAALKAAWGEYYPSVSLDLTRYLARDTFPDDVDWTALLKINVPIFSAGLIHADVRTAYSRLRQARFAEKYTRRQVVKDLRVTVANLRGDDQRLAQLALEVQAAEEAVRQAEAEFDNGVGTNLQRLVARQGLLAAKLARSTAQFDRNFHYLQLLRETGELNPQLSVAAEAAGKSEPRTDNLAPAGNQPKKMSTQ